MFVKSIRFIVLNVAITASFIAIGHAISYVFG